MAQAIDLADGASGTSMTLTWTDLFGGVSIGHTASYSLVGTDLKLYLDGGEITVARNVSSLTFSRCKSRLSLDMTVSPPGRDGVSMRLIYSFLIRLADTTTCVSSVPVVGPQPP